MRNSSFLLVFLGLAASVRSFFLAQPMRYDEAYSFLHFIYNRWIMLFDYPLPNNHIFYSVLARLCIGVLGPAEFAVRLPAFLAGLSLIPLTVMLCRRVIGSHAGFFSAAIMAVFPYLILFDTQARGYSLLTALTVGSALFLHRLVERPGIRTAAGLGICMAFGFWTMPSFLLGAAGLGLWGFTFLLGRPAANRRSILRAAGLAALICLGVSFVFYIPTFFTPAGINGLIHNPYFRPLSLTSILSCFLDHAVRTSVQLFRGIPLFLVFVFCGLAAYGAIQAARKSNHALYLQFPSLLLGGALVVLVKRNIPYDRSWIYLLPFFFILVEAGGWQFLRLLGGRLAARAVKLLVCAFCCAMSVHLMAANRIARFPDTGQFVEASMVARFLASEMRVGDRYHAATPADAPLDFALFRVWMQGAPEKPADGSAPRHFYVVKPSRYRMAPELVETSFVVLRFEDAIIFASQTPPPAPGSAGPFVFPHNRHGFLEDSWPQKP